MYCDDPFSTNDEDNMEELININEVHSVYSDASSINTNKKKMRMMHELMNSQDKGYRKYLFQNNYEVMAYSTAIVPGNKIRDAITGLRDSKYKVGSLDEDLFFKIRIAISHSGFEKDKNRTETTLFYDSPEQFERHMNTTISQENKQLWIEKRNKQLAKCRR